MQYREPASKNERKYGCFLFAADIRCEGKGQAPTIFRRHAIEREGVAWWRQTGVSLRIVLRFY
jgi:hypothetical protein